MQLTRDLFAIAKFMYHIISDISKQIRRLVEQDVAPYFLTASSNVIYNAITIFPRPKAPRCSPLNMSHCTWTDD